MAEVKQRMDLESAAAEKLARLSDRHRIQALKLLGNPPDASRLNADFWDKIQRETQEELTALLLLIFIASAMQHGLGQDRSTALGQSWSAGRSALVARRFAENSRRDIASIVADVRQREGKLSEVRERVGNVFGKSRAELIAATETTEASVAGAEAGVNETVGFSEDDTWFTEADDRVCPICQPLRRTKRSEWSRLFRSGPPAHARCRCWIHYANEKRGAAVLARN